MHLTCEDVNKKINNTRLKAVFQDKPWSRYRMSRYYGFYWNWGWWLCRRCIYTSVRQ